MSLATKTIDQVRHGSAREKAEALLKFAMFYAAISYIVSVAFFYLGFVDMPSLVAVVGLLISIAAGFVKFGH